MKRGARNWRRDVYSAVSEAQEVRSEPRWDQVLRNTSREGRGIASRCLVPTRETLRAQVEYVY